ncbi:zinc transporter [Poseidonocella pacifica]|uniref:Zinc transporter n=1 Tax=Poseidonocella pacifica TaxID=871651 RepID=A0A1I0WN58_9RHOB|nr:zinc transporter ZntB [Poseidonocella pacifica]SFA89994.1 zinc transporter [Poseidonocella pacifica]
MTDAIEYAFAFDKDAPARRVPGADIAAVLESETFGWVHLSALHPETEGWIEGQLDYLDETITDALIAEETRPRFTPIGVGALVILRGINTNLGAEPDDMVSVRLWIDANRVITVSRRPVPALHEMAEAFDRGEGPRDAGAFIATIAEMLADRIDLFAQAADDEADALEEMVIDRPSRDMRERLTDLRMQAVRLRRYGIPQRDALAALALAEFEWLSPPDRRRLSEEHDAMVRLVEDMEAMRERMTLLREELSGELSERLNRNMYMLSILSAVFLPLGFLTGLFGINLAGMPGAQHSGAFWIFSAALVVVVGVQLLIIRRMNWI